MLWRNERTVKEKCVMAICNAGKIRECGLKRSRGLRVRHEPKRTNEAYATVRRLPYDNHDIELLELLAAEAVVAVRRVGEVTP